MSITLCLFSVALMGVFTHLYFNFRKDYKDNAKALTFKASCTLVPVLLCLYALFTRSTIGTRWLLFAGVFLCMAADVVIGIHFTFGTLVFLGAQLCFIAYFLTIAPLKWPSLLLLIGILAIEAVLLRPSLQMPLGRMVCCGTYAAALAFMVSLAILLPFSVFTAGTVCIAVGAVLFLISDTLLAKNTFGTPSFLIDRLLMYFYYPAVYLIAVSAFSM